MRKGEASRETFSAKLLEALPSLNGGDPLQEQIFVALLLALRKVEERDFEQALQLLEVASFLVRMSNQRSQKNLEKSRPGFGP